MFHPEREVRDRREILDILGRCDCLNLALTDGAFPYVIPMNFGCEMRDDALVIYFHGAKQGKKWELVRQNPHGAFCASCDHEYVPGKVACASLFRYESVCGQGTIKILEGDERMHALSVIMGQYDRDTSHAFTEKHAAAVTIAKMTVTELTGKRREKK